MDEAIRIHNKLLILLSQNSVGSPWVGKEVETAFGKEFKFESKGKKKSTAKNGCTTKMERDTATRM